MLQTLSVDEIKRFETLAQQLDRLGIQNLLTPRRRAKIEYMKQRLENKSTQQNIAQYERQLATLLGEQQCHLIVSLNTKQCLQTFEMMAFAALSQAQQKTNNSAQVETSRISSQRNQQPPPQIKHKIQEEENQSETNVSVSTRNNRSTPQMQQASQKATLRQSLLPGQTKQPENQVFRQTQSLIGKFLHQESFQVNLSKGTSSTQNNNNNNDDSILMSENSSNMAAQAEQVLREVLSEEHFEIVEASEGLRILRDTRNTKRLKMKLSVKCEARLLANTLCSFDAYRQWNAHVVHAKVVRLLPEQFAAIVHARVAAHGTLYRGREFVFLRCLTHLAPNAILLLDQSINYEDLEESHQTPRARMKVVKWLIYNNLLTVDAEIYHEGLVSKQQDSDMTLKFLKSFAFVDTATQQHPLPICPAMKLFEIEERLNRREKFQISDDDQNESQEDEKTEQISENFSPFKNKTLEETANDCGVYQSFSELGLQSLQDDVTSNEFHNALEEENGEKICQEIGQFCEQYCLQRQEGLIERVQNEIDENEIVMANKDWGREECLQKMEMVRQNKHWLVCLDKKFVLAPFVSKAKYQMSTPEKGHFIFKKDFVRDDKKGYLLYVNQEKINNQTRVISYLLKSVGKNFFTGKSIINISLPVSIFDRCTNLERTAQSFCYAPHYLEMYSTDKNYKKQYIDTISFYFKKRAALTNDPVQQMKYTVVYSLSTFPLYLGLEKPFNPILGETFQAWVNGNPVYCEQIMHHPPIMAYLMYGRGYRIDSRQQSVADMHTNSVTACGIGNVNFKYLNNGTKISVQAPSILLNGTVFGQRTFNTVGRLWAWDLENNLFTEIKYNPEKAMFQKTPQDYFRGHIYRVTEQFKLKFQQKYKQGLYENEKLKFNGLKQEDIVQTYLMFDGIWEKEIKVDGETLWTSEGPLPHVLEYEKYPLPSDCNFREDVLAFRMGDQDFCQQEKERLEVLQRGDRKLRERLAQSKGKKAH